MKKETFHKKWYYRLLQVIFFGSLIAFSLFLIIAGILGSDVEIAGFFWAGVLAIVYWLIKRIFYYFMFREKIFDKNQKGVSIGFISGIVIALVWLMIISIIYPAEEIANIVIVSLLISGLIFGFVGYWIQNYFRSGNTMNKKTKKKYTWRNYTEYIKDNPKGLWFKMRLYGWGWVPASWQGWTIILVLIAVLLLNVVYFVSKVSLNNEATSSDLAIFFGVIIISIILIFWICYKKGEWPKWSWGR